MPPKTHRLRKMLGLPASPFRNKSGNTPSIQSRPIKKLPIFRGATPLAPQKKRDPIAFNLKPKRTKASLLTPTTTSTALTALDPAKVIPKEAKTQEPSTPPKLLADSLHGDAASLDHASKPKPPSFPHLQPISITEEKGNISFAQLSGRIQTTRPYHLPLHWPTPRIQNGQCCGLYALELALKYAFPEKKVPPARKRGDRLYGTSLRQIAKEKGFTSFGPIFDIHYLQKIAAIAGFPYSKAQKLNSFSQESYARDLCTLLQEGQSVIVSCDLHGANGFPGESQGLRSHWATVFGFGYINDECHFLVSQWGEYYLWPASRLYQSNLGLPIDNPRCAPHYLHYKTKTFKAGTMTKEDHFIKTSADLAPEILKQARYCKETSLLPFRFTALATPTPALKNCINLETGAMRAAASSPSSLAIKK